MIWKSILLKSLWVFQTFTEGAFSDEGICAPVQTSGSSLLVIVCFNCMKETMLKAGCVKFFQKFWTCHQFFLWNYLTAFGAFCSSFCSTFWSLVFFWAVADMFFDRKKQWRFNQPQALYLLDVVNFNVNQCVLMAKFLIFVLRRVTCLCFHVSKIIRIVKLSCTKFHH